MAAYELWELESGNLVGSFPTQEAALLVVAATIRKYGYSTVETTLLTQVDGGESKDIAGGMNLAKMALDVAKPSTTSPHRPRTERPAKKSP